MCTARRAVCFVHNAVNIGVEMHDYGNRCFSSDTLSTVVAAATMARYTGAGVNNYDRKIVEIDKAEPRRVYLLYRTL